MPHQRLTHRQQFLTLGVMVLRRSRQSFFLGQLKLPLRVWLVVPFLLQMLGAVGLVGYFSYRSRRQAIAALANQLLAEVGDRIDQTLNNYLQKPQEITQLNAAALELGAVDGQDFTTLERYFWRQMDIYDVTSVSIITETHHSLVIQEEKDGSRVIHVTEASTNGAVDHYLADAEGNRQRRLNRIPGIDHPVSLSNPTYARARETGRSRKMSCRWHE